MSKLSADEINHQIKNLPDWAIIDGQLVKEFKFKDFDRAFEFMTKLAIEAKKMNHHPDWSNSYNQVIVRLYTHSVNGLSENDFRLARAANKIAQEVFM